MDSVSTLKQNVAGLRAAIDKGDLSEAQNLAQTVGISVRNTAPVPEGSPQAANDIEDALARTGLENKNGENGLYAKLAIIEGKKGGRKSRKSKKPKRTSRKSRKGGTRRR
jgi:hypothetical protein